MTISMYHASAPRFANTLKNLSAILDKAAGHCEAKKIDPAVLLQSRLYPDMFPLVRQVQLTADFAKGIGARLAGVEPPKYPDTETTIDELKARLAKTADFLKGLKPAQLDGSETREITIPIPNQPLTFNGQSYLVHFALPNLYFHATTAYDILRHCGVEIGKRDYMGAPPA